MPAITSLSLSAAISIRRTVVALGLALGRTLAAHLARLGRKFKNRHAAQTLAKFDDRMLADIGLTRFDVQDAYAQSLWDDPTNLLRARALERRLARLGITHGLASERALLPSIAPQVDDATVSQARMTFCKCA